MPKQTDKKRTIAQIRKSPPGTRTHEEIKRLDEANTRNSKLYKSIVNPQKKKKKE